MAGLSIFDYINAFWNKQLLGPVSLQACGLYYAILYFANRAGWPDEICIPRSTILAITKTKKSNYYNYRKELEKAGLIQVKKGKKDESAIFTLCCIIPEYWTNSGTYSGTNSGTNSGTISKHNTKTNRDGKSKRFSPPSLDEIKAYCDERNNTIDPEQFFDHYQANGWVQGKGAPIKDWKAAVRTWERNERKPHQAQDRALDRAQAVAAMAREWPENPADTKAAKAWTNRLYNAGKALTADDIKRIKPALLLQLKEGKTVVSCFENTNDLEGLLNGKCN